MMLKMSYAIVEGRFVNHSGHKTFRKLVLHLQTVRDVSQDRRLLRAVGLHETSRKSKTRVKSNLSQYNKKA